MTYKTSYKHPSSGEEKNPLFIFKMGLLGVRGVEVGGEVRKTGTFPKPVQKRETNEMAH